MYPFIYLYFLLLNFIDYILLKHQKLNMSKTLKIINLFNAKLKKKEKKIQN